MRYHRFFLPLPCLTLLAACASTQVPVETMAPLPTEVLLRAVILSPCPRPGDCGQRAVEHVRGILVFTDADSLVMTDMASRRRVTIWPDADAQLYAYRGQHRSFQAAVEGGLLGAAKGAAAGAGSSLLMGGLATLLGADTDVGEAVRDGAILGAGAGVLAGANRAIAEGRAVWEPVTLLQLRQQMCRCPDPDHPTTQPALETRQM